MQIIKAPFKNVMATASKAAVIYVQDKKKPAEKRKG
jgi:hypothetical protein